MLQEIIGDVSGIIRGVFLNGDWVSLAIAFGSVVVAAFVMRRASQIGAMTLLALTLFVIGGFVRGALRGAAEPAAGATNRAVWQFQSSWSQFMNMQAGTLLAYFIAFMLLILVFFAVKSAVSRG